MNVVGFYEGAYKDSRNRELNQILAKDDDWLERTHDYIQWLFPLEEPSRMVRGSPILFDYNIAQFHNSPSLQKALLRSFARMMSFYGLCLKEGALESGLPLVLKAEDYESKRTRWQRVGDHNHLRLTRIMKSLDLLGLSDHARALQSQLRIITKENPAAFSETTVGFWKSAVSGGTV